MTLPDDVAGSSNCTGALKLAPLSMDRDRRMVWVPVTSLRSHATYRLFVNGLPATVSIAIISLSSDGTVWPMSSTTGTGLLHVWPPSVDLATPMALLFLLAP